MLHSIYFQVVHHCCLSRIFLGNDECFVFQFTCLDGNGKRTSHGKHLSTQSQFAHEHVSLKVYLVSMNMAKTQEKGNGDGEVEARTLLAHIGR